MTCLASNGRRNTLLHSADPTGMMLAAASDVPSPTGAAVIFGIFFTLCFVGVFALAFRSANRNRPASDAELRARLRRADHDELVRQHRENIRGVFDDGTRPGR